MKKRRTESETLSHMLAKVRYKDGFTADGVQMRRGDRFHPGEGRQATGPRTPSEILFELQLQARGFIEIDIVIRTKEPLKYEKRIVGTPTIIRGLEPGEIMKLRRDLEGFLLWWRGELARERDDEAIGERMEIQ